MYLTWGSYLGPINGAKHHRQLGSSSHFHSTLLSGAEPSGNKYQDISSPPNYHHSRLSSINLYSSFNFITFFYIHLTPGMLMPLSRVAAGALAVAVPRQPLLNTVAAATAGALRRTTPRAAVKGSFAHHQTQSRTNSTMSSQQIIVNTDKAPAGEFCPLMTPQLQVTNKAM